MMNEKKIQGIGLGGNVNLLIWKIMKKGLQLCLTLFLLSLFVFCLSSLAPGDPLRSYYGDGAEHMSIAQREAAQKQLGLDQPMLKRYGIWIYHATKGEFGISFQYKQEVTKVIVKAVPNTVLLAGTAFFLTFGLALLLGIFCALHEDSFADRIICKIGTILSCIPSFWMALMLILLFSVTLGVLPSGGAYLPGESGNFLGRIRYLILPLTVMVVSHLWYYAYLARNSLLEEIREDYVLFCRARGLSRKKTLICHCLRNIMPSYISMMAISVPHILGGTYIVEKVFSYPGLGTLCFESAKYQDYNLLMLLTMITGTLVVISNMAADSLSKRIDLNRRQEDYAFEIWN